jgi:hypothetical protein
MPYSLPDPSSSNPQQPAVSANDSLPPIEPPSAGFLIQLFLVPGLIVLMILMVWLALNWLARGSDDLYQLIERMKVPSVNRFQYAHQLATALGSPRHDHFKADSRPAQDLAKILAAEIEAGELRDEPLNLRIFLCRALGEMHVDDGMDVLLRAATTQRSQKELDVRTAAVAAIAIRAERASRGPAPKRLQDPQLHDALLRLADDPQPLVRSFTAMALPWLGTPSSIAKLEEMLHDSDTNARYNAALNLARLGNVHSASVLEEMLDPEQAVALESETQPSDRALKQATILVNALRAVKMLAEHNPDADLTRLMQSIEELESSNVQFPIRVQAREVLNQLHARAAREDLETGPRPPRAAPRGC